MIHNIACLCKDSPTVEVKFCPLQTLSSVLFLNRNVLFLDRNSRYYAPSYPWLEYSRLPFHFGNDFGRGIWRHRRIRRSMLYDYFPYWWWGYHRRLHGSQQPREPPLVSFLHLVLVRCFRGISCPTDVRNIRTVACVVCTK